MNINWFEPLNFQDPSHVQASESKLQFMAGWFANPLLKGDYPQIMRENVMERLPSFTSEESQEILHSIDFLGINHYTTSLVFPNELANLDNSNSKGWFSDSKVCDFQDPAWYTSASSWLKVTPFGIRRLMNWIRDNYGHNLPIYITENGVSDHLGNIDDVQRIYYIKHYTNQLLKAIKLDAIGNIAGYFAWSLLDNFEWAQGFS